MAARCGEGGRRRLTGGGGADATAVTAGVVTTLPAVEDVGSATCSKICRLRLAMTTELVILGCNETDPYLASSIILYRK